MYLTGWPRQEISRLVPGSRRVSPVRFGRGLRPVVPVFIARGVVVDTDGAAEAVGAGAGAGALEPIGEGLPKGDAV